MPPRMRFMYAALMFSLLMMGAIPLLQEMMRPRNIWWTPQTMMVPLAQASDRVEIYARDETLGSLLQMGRLQVVDQEHNNTLKPSDVALRFNNWDRVRADRMPGLLVDAAVCGMMVMFLLLLATGRLAWRNET